jgi:hypothetical protein
MFYVDKTFCKETLIEVSRQCKVLYNSISKVAHGQSRQPQMRVTVRLSKEVNQYAW